MPERPDQLFLDFQSVLAGRYSLEREVGRGGMGVVYLAREVRLDRPVAVKLLPPVRAGDERLRERFLREARTAAKLSHPHIIPIFAVDEVGAFVFFAMAYVAGETLTERVRRRGPLPPSEAGRLLREVAWALAYAPAQGLVHSEARRDNIIQGADLAGALAADAIDRCLEKDPLSRPQKGEELADQLGLALEQRRELPVALRVFVKRNARLGGVGGLIYVFSIPFMMGFIGSLFGRSGGDAALWTFVAAVTVVPLGILAGRARRFRAVGF